MNTLGTDFEFTLKEFVRKGSTLQTHKWIVTHHLWVSSTKHCQPSLSLAYTHILRTAQSHGKQRPTELNKADKAVIEQESDSEFEEETKTGTTGEKKADSESGGNDKPFMWRKWACLSDQKSFCFMPWTLKVNTSIISTSALLQVCLWCWLSSI